MDILEALSIHCPNDWERRYNLLEQVITIIAAEREFIEYFITDNSQFLMLIDKPTINIEDIDAFEEAVDILSNRANAMLRLFDDNKTHAQEIFKFKRSQNHLFAHVKRNLNALYNGENNV